MDTVEKITKLIEESGKSASSILKELNFSPTALSEWKRGKAKPTADALTKIADYFDVSVDYLLGRTDTPTPETSDLEMPAELESVRMAFYGGPSNLSQKSLQDIAEYVKFIQERDKKEKK